MSTDIRTALERNARAVSLRPSVGQGTAVTRVSLRDQLTCDISEGQWHLTAAMTGKYGGSGEGPNPGVLGRAALGSCLALGYAMWAARLDVPIASLEVEVHADYDVRGELGVDASVRPGYSAIRCVVTIASPAPQAEVERVLDTADRCSSWLDNLANAVPVTRDIRYTRVARPA